VYDLARPHPSIRQIRCLEMGHRRLTLTLSSLLLSDYVTCLSHPADDSSNQLKLSNCCSVNQ